MVTTTNLVSYWKLDESSTGVSAVTRNDSHSTNHLTDTNTTESATGKISNGANFKLANTERLSITDASQTGLEPTGSWSISLWINATSTPASNNFMALVGKTQFNNTSSWGIQLFNNAGTMSIDLDSRKSTTEPAELLVAQTITTGTWYHIVGVFTSATELRIYVNGTSIGSTSTVRTNPANNAMDVTFGSISGGGNYFDGIIDEVGFWSRALTSSDVTDLYNGGNGLAYPFTGGSVTLAKQRHTLLTLGVG